MKNKKQDKGFKELIIGMVCSILIIAFVLILVYSSKPNFKITKDGVEVNNLTACCVKVKSIDYFENYSGHHNASQTITTNYVGKEIFCFSEGQNILSFDCKLIEKKELDRDWLDENCECIEVFNKEIENNKDYLIHKTNNCRKYKFGDYIINIEK